MIRHALTALLLLAAAACDTATHTTAPASAAAARAPAQTARNGDGCVPLDAWLEGGKNAFRFSSAMEDDRWTARLAVKRDGKTSQGRISVSGLDPAAITVEEADLPQATRVCGGHVLVVNLSEERGGTLLIGNLHEGGLALTAYRYASGDEDSAEPDFRAGVLSVKTGAEGLRRLVEDSDAEAAVPHGYVPETVACVREDTQGTTHLRLSVDAAGEVYALSYLSVMPDGLSCSLDARQGQDETTWRNGQSGLRIVWGAEADASRVGIRRKDNLYTVDARQVRPPDFCGHSAQLADVITLRRGEKTCASVTWPQ